MIGLLIGAVLLLAASALIYFDGYRSPIAVFRGLAEDEPAKITIAKQYSWRLFIPPIVILIVAIIGALSNWSLLTQAILSAGFLVTRHIYLKQQKIGAAKYELRKLEFYLPLLMERIVMSAQSGLDIVPALREASKESNSDDFAAKYMAAAIALVDKGVNFDEALQEISQKTNSTIFRHALLHIGLAYKEGGELIRPLRELSDSTQLYYQERVEEEIAKMPVKAMGPLMCTFIGLLLMFLTVPMIELSTSLSSAAEQFKSQGVK